MFGGGTQVGAVYTTLGFHVDDKGASAYDRLVAKLRHGSERPITTTAKFDAKTDGAHRYEQAVNKADHANSNFIRGSGRLRTGLGTFAVGGPAIAGAVVGFGLLTKGVIDATKGYQDHLKIVAQTAAVIKSTGGAAGVTTKHITDMSNALEAKTAIDNDVIQSGANMLLTFKNVRNEAGKGNDVFNQATTTLVDMSSALGTDASTSAIQLGKALNDPIKGISALQRVGVTFTQGQKDQITTLVKSGDTLKAQKLILKELNSEFGGSAAKNATSTGKLATAFRNLQDSIGHALLPYVNKAADAITGIINQMHDGVGAGGRLSAILKIVAHDLGVGFTIAWGVASKAFAIGKQLIEDNRGRLIRIGKAVTDLWGTFFKMFGKIATVFKQTFGSGSSTGRDIKTIIANILSLVGTFEKLLNTVVKRALPGIITAFRGLALIIRGVIRVISGILSGDFGKAWDGVKDIFSGAVKALGGIIRAGTAPLRAAAAAIGKAIGGAFSSAWGAIKHTAQGFVNDIIDVLNIIPGVNLKHVGGGGGGSSSGPAASTPGLNAPLSSLGTLPITSHTHANTRSVVPGYAEGGRVTAPVAIYGEEAPQHPEWVLPTNPAYRSRAIGLWMAAAKDLGIPGFALGGLNPMKALHFIEGLPGKAIHSVTGLASSLVGKLPGNPGGILKGAFGYGLSKAKNFIEDKAGGVWKAAKDALGLGGGGGGGGSTTGLVPQVLRAIAYARAHGWTGSILSGFRSYAEQATLYARYLAGGNLAAKPGQSNHESGQAVDVSNPGQFAAALANAPANSKLYNHLPTDPDHYSTTGFAMGGLVGPGGVRLFAKGGKNTKPPKAILTHKQNRGITRSVARGESGIRSYEQAIQDMETTYDQMDRRFGLTDENFLIENPDGSTTVNDHDVTQRRIELGSLIKQRTKIKHKVQAYRAAITKLMTSLRSAIKTLREALAAAKGKARQKERGGYRDAIHNYSTRLGELKKTYGDLGFDVSDNQLDLDELTNEDTAVRGTVGAAAPADTNSDTGNSDTGNSDTGAPADPGQAPPSATQIAVAAAAAFASFTQSRQDLFTGFGSNYEQAGTHLFGDDGRQAAGVRYFGAFGNEQGGSSSPHMEINLTNHFAEPPPDPHTWSQQQRFQIEGAIG